MDPRRRLAVLLICGLAIFTDVVGIGVVVPALPQFAALFGASEAALAYAFSAFSVAFLITALPLGYLVDRTGRADLVTFLGMACVGGSALSFALADRLWIFALGQALHGVGSVAAWVAAQPLVARISGESDGLGMGMGVITVAMGLGLIVGPALGSLDGLRTPFVAHLGIAVVAAMLVLLVLRGERTHHGDAGLHYGAILRRRSILAACLVMLVLYAGIGMMEVLFPLYMDSLGYAKSGIGLLFVVLAVTMTASQPLVGRWIRRVGATLPVGVCLVVVAALLTLMVAGRSFAAWTPVFLVLGIAVGMGVSASMFLVAAETRPEERGAAYGLWNFSFSVGYLIGPVVGGTLAQVTAGGGFFSGLRSPFVVFSGIFILMLIPILRLAGRSRYAHADSA
jgi:MFS transporter, DHA1 family, solute carrier family 18 (vesicular amine transporter), member 1/2